MYPPLCVQCQEITEGPPLCPHCYQEIQYPWQQPQLKLAPLCIDEFFTAMLYEPPITHLIHQIKYKRLAPLAPFAAELLYDSVYLPLPDLVTAVPLHKDRERWRGFNQSELIAKKYSALIARPYIRTLTRIEETPTQASLKLRKERLSNLAKSFQPLPALNTTALQNKHILLIDDVATTGTTLNECSKVLKQLGATKITGLTLAHGS